MFNPETLVIRIPSDLGREVRRARIAAKLKATAIAKESGRSRDVLYRLEKGDDVTVASLMDILRAMGLTLRLERAGVTLAVIFQMAHCVEGVAYPEGSEGRLPHAWSDHQLHTTANFGATPLSTWMTGGLNHQIEHHLLPHICHIHLPRLAPIVAACAREHGLPYLHSGSFPAALRSHFRMLRRLGAGPS